MYVRSHVIYPCTAPIVANGHSDGRAVGYWINPKAVGLNLPAPLNFFFSGQDLSELQITYLLAGNGYINQGNTNLYQTPWPHWSKLPHPNVPVLYGPLEYKWTKQLNDQQINALVYNNNVQYFWVHIKDTHDQDSVSSFHFRQAPFKLKFSLAYMCMCKLSKLDSHFCEIHKEKLENTHKDVLTMQ